MIEDEGKLIRWEIELPELNELDFSVNDFHEDLIVQTSSVDGFGSYLFYDLEFFKTDNGIEFVFSCHQPNKLPEYMVIKHLHGCKTGFGVRPGNVQIHHGGGNIGMAQLVFQAHNIEPHFQ